MKQFWRLVISLLACSCFIFESVAAPMMGSPLGPNSGVSATSAQSQFLASLAKSSADNFGLTSPLDELWQSDPTKVRLGVQLSEEQLREIFKSDNKLWDALPFTFDNKIYDNFHFANQKVLIWEKVKNTAPAPSSQPYWGGGAKSVEDGSAVAKSGPPPVAVKAEYSLNEFQVDIPTIHAILDQLRFTGLDDGSLKIEYVLIDRKSRQEYPRATQIIPDLGIRNNQVVSDGNFVFMLTDTGIKMIFRPYTDAYLFNAPIPVFTILPGLVKADNIEVEKIEIIDAGSQPRALLHNEDLSPADRFKEGDFVIQVKVDGERQNILISREALVAQARIQCSILVSYMFLINPSLKNSPAFLAFMKQEMAMKEIEEGTSLVAQALVEEDILQKAPQQDAALAQLGQGPNPIAEAQRTFGLLSNTERDGVSFYARATQEKFGQMLGEFMQKDGEPDAFTTLAQENRSTVLQDEWVELYNLTKDLPEQLLAAKKRVLLERQDNNIFDRLVLWGQDNFQGSLAAKISRDKYPKLLNWRKAVQEIYHLFSDKERTASVKEILRKLPQDSYKLADLIIKRRADDMAQGIRGLTKGGLKIMGYLAAVGVTAELLEVTGQQIFDVSLMHKTFALISQMLYASLNNEVAAAITGPIVTSGEYFHKLWLEHAGVEALMWVAGTTAALSSAFLAISFGARNFFTYGIKLYLALNSIHKYFFNFLGLKNLRPAITHAINPWKNKELFRRVNTPDKQRANLDLVSNNLALDQQASGKALAAVLAQSVGLSDEQTQQVLEEADGNRLALLGKAAQTLSPEQIEKNSAMAEQVAAQYAPKVRTANQASLADLQDAKDAQELADQYSQRLKEVADELQKSLRQVRAQEAAKEGKKLSPKGIILLQKATSKSIDKLGHIYTEIRDGLLLGRQAAISNQELDGINLDDETVKIATKMFLIDYVYSVLSAGGALPERYAKFLVFFCNSDGALALQDTVEQLVLYGGLGAIGPFYSKAKPIGFEPAWKPLINELNVREGKKFSGFALTRDFVKSWFDPKIKNGVMHTHLNAEILSALYGFEARMWFGGIPRFLAFFLIFKEADKLDWATALTSPTLIGSSFLIGMLIQGFFNLSKFSYNFSVFYPGLGMPFVSLGYCMPWAVVIRAMRYAGEVIRGNQKLIKNADYFLQEAVTSPAPETYAKAIEAVEKVLKKANEKLPDVFKLAAAEYTPEQIKKLQQWFDKRGEEVLPTAENKLWSIWANLTGSIGSVVLYAYVTLKLMTSDMTVLASAGYFGGSILSLAATFLFYDAAVNYFDQMKQWPSIGKFFKDKFTKAGKQKAQKIPAASKELGSAFKTATTKIKTGIWSTCAKFLK